jgi:hypothetical protein
VSHGGAPLTGYTVTAYVGYFPARVQSFNSLATTQVITGLSNGRTYRFAVAAKSTVTGPQSTLTEAITVGAPLAPTAVSANVGPGAGQATLHWTAPPNNGSAIIGYNVRPYQDGVALPARAYSSTATTVTVTNLTRGKSYTFRIAARNARGVGPYSAATNTITAT